MASDIKIIKMETWKDVVGYEGRYQVSNTGVVKSIKRKVVAVKTLFGKKHNPFEYFIKERMLTAGKDKDGYLYYKLCNGDGSSGKMPKAHRLVATAFISNPEGLTQINHINGVKIDNRVENLEWCTRSHNTRHAIRTGLFIHKRKLDKNQVSEIMSSELSIVELAKKFKVSYSTAFRTKKQPGYYK